MIHLRVTYARRVDLARALEQEFGRGALLVRVAPPEDLGFRDKAALQIVGPSGAFAEMETEVMSLLPGVGVALAVRLTPRPLWEARLREAEASAEKLPRLWWGAGLIVLLWAVLFGLFVWWLVRLFAAA